MSFSFGFSSNDLSDDEIDGASQLGNADSSKYAGVYRSGNPLDDERLKVSTVVQPKLHELKDILTSLVNVRVSFEQFETPGRSTVLYRRELFDVKHQLMSEFDDSHSQNVEMDILMGETSEDLRKNVYEGGLKSWECSIDVVETLTENESLLADFDCILELGCGTSLPSEHIFRRYLQGNFTTGLKLILSDYNESVLRLVTVPNMIVTWAKTVLSNQQWLELQQSENNGEMPTQFDELLFTSKLLDAFFQDLQTKNISIVLISGTWGRSFSQIIDSQISMNKGLLAITSETIYQPENLPVVAETLIEILLVKRPLSTKALVAAKDIYFGVGGSIVEFEKYLNEQITQRSLALSFYTYKVNVGLRRSIVSIE